MKFLCENCKAKYQIADEKVVGRTVRMKCRKCGNFIQVEASVTETSVANKPPRESKAAPAPLPPKATDAAEAAPPPPAPPRDVPAEGAKKVALPPPRPTGSFTSKATPAPTAVGKAAPKPPAKTPTPAPSPVASASSAKSQPQPSRPSAAPSTGLASAFSKSLANPQPEPSSVSAAMEVLSASSSTEEWYVGINGVPVGPVRLSELRRKAAGGFVDEESLVWREGFEEWVPLRTFPELRAMLVEATTSGGSSASIVPPAPTAPKANPRPAQAPPRQPNAVAPAARPSPPARPPAAPARNNVVPISSRLATAERFDEIDVPVVAEAEHPPAASQTTRTNGKSASTSLAALESSQLAAGEGSVPAVATKATSHSVSAPAPRQDSIAERLSSLSLRPSRKRIHPAAFAVIALVGVLIGMGGALFLIRAPQPQVQIVTVTAPPAVTLNAPPPPPEEGVTTIEPIEVERRTPSKAPKAAAEPKGSPSNPAPALNLNGLTGVGGPSSPGVSGNSGGSGQLAAAEVERVVQSHRPFVKRQCWEPALSGRLPGAPASARVVVSITIAGDGHVQNASATGGDGYPGLPSCVQNNVKTWKFPTSEGANVSVPFVFAAQ